MEAEAHEESASWRSILCNLFVLRLSFGLMLYVGAELGLANWIAAYMARDLGSSLPLASASVAMFWIGIGLGRVATTACCHKVSDATIIRWSMGLGAAFIAALLVSRSSYAALPAVFCAGFALGPAWPTIVSRAGAAFPSQSGSVIGIVAACGCMGGAIAPKLIGWISYRTGIIAQAQEYASGWKLPTQLIGLRGSLWICVLALLGGLVVVNLGGKKRAD